MTLPKRDLNNSAAQESDRSAASESDPDIPEDQLWESLKTPLLEKDLDPDAAFDWSLLAMLESASNIWR